MKVQRTIEVDCDHLVPKGHVGIEKVSKDVPTGDVGQKVDGADIPFERGDRLGNLIALGDVDTIARGTAAAGDGGRFATAAVDVQDADRTTFLGEPFGGGTADAAGAAR